MGELRSLVEREMRRAGSASYSFVDVVARRDRRRRNQRLRAAVVACLIALVALGGLFRAIQTGTRSQPAAPTLTTSNVDRLHQIWTGNAGTATSAPVVSDGRVYVSSVIPHTSQGALVAFPAHCEAQEGACPPTWTGMPGATRSEPSTGDGLVLVEEERNPHNPDAGGRLFAFDEACGADGVTCTPTWIAHTGGAWASWVAPVVQAGVVYVAAPNSEVLAFSAACGQGGAKCRPLWTASAGGHVTSLAAAGDTLIVGTGGPGQRSNTVEAFATTCPTVRCEPLWSRPMDGAVYGITVVGNDLYVGTSAGYRGRGPGLDVFSLSSCEDSAGRCEPLWVADRRGDVVTTSASDSLVFVQDFAGLSAYPAHCGTDGSACTATWTADVPAAFTQGLMPVVTGDLVFTATRDGRILAFPVGCAGRCAPIWSADAGMGALGGIAVSDGQVYASSDHGLVVFGLEEQN